MEQKWRNSGTPGGINHLQVFLFQSVASIITRSLELSLQ